MTASSRDSASAEAARLVSATRIDRLVSFGLRQYLARGHDRNKGKVPEQEKRFLACVDVADSTVYIGPLSNELAKLMSEEEIREAHRFFEGRAGGNLIESDLATLTKLFSGDSVPLRELSAGEEQELRQFRKTPAGKKLLVSGILNADPMADLMARKAEELARACARRAHEGGQ